MDSRQHSTAEKLKPQEELPNQKLPYELLLMIFSYLNLPYELLIVQNVCSGWRAAALDKSLWKKFTLSLHGADDEKKIINSIPIARKINGYANNDVISLILKNNIEISKLNVDFNPPLSFLQLQAVLEKYPNLETIYLHVNAPDILKCLDILKTSKHLTKIKFITSGFKFTDFDLLQVFSVFNDRKNFSSLRKTNLVDLALRNDFCNKQSIMTALSTFISNRSNQLLVLNINLHSPYLNLRETVSKCTKLQKLMLRSCSHPSDIIISNMTELKLLYIVFYCLADGENFDALQEYIHTGSWAYLTSVSISLCVTSFTPVEKHILNDVIRNMKQLTYLHYADDGCSLNESELREVGNLPNLVYLSVRGVNSISEVGMIYISSCPKLKHFDFSAEASPINKIHDCVRNTVRELPNMESFQFFVKENLQLRTIRIYLWNKEECIRFASS